MNATHSYMDKTPVAGFMSQRPESQRYFANGSMNGHFRPTRAHRAGTWTAAVGAVLALAFLLGGAALAFGGISTARGAHGTPVASSMTAVPSAAPRPHSVGTVVATITVGSDPEALAFDATDNKMFVANQAGGGTASDPGNLTVINPATNTISGWISLPYSSNSGAPGPNSLAYDGANGELYVVDEDNMHLSVLDAATNANLSWLSLTTSAGLSGALALDSNSGTLFMVSYDNQSVYTIDTASNTLTGNFYTEPANANLLQLPQQECFDPANGDLYVGQQNAYGTGSPSDLVVDNAASHAFITNFTTASSEGTCVYDSTNGDIYAVGGTGNLLMVINGATNTLTTTITYTGSTGAAGIAFDPNNGYLYTADSSSSTVHVFDGATNTLLGSIPVATDPRDIAFDSTNGDIYVGSTYASLNSGTVSVIDPNAVSSSGGPTISSFTASPSTISLGQSTTYSVSVSGGTTPYTYSYSALPSGCVSQNVPALACTPTVAGGYTSMVTVTDATGKTVTSNPGAALRVNSPSGYPNINSFTASPSSVNVGSPTTFSVQASGGTPPYTYSYLSLPPGCTSQNTASLSCTPSSSGNYTVRVTVTDANAHPASATTTLTVTSGSTNNGSPSGGGNGLLVPIVIGVVVVAVVAGLAIYFLKVRKPKVPTPSPAAPSAYGQAPPPPPPS